MLFIEGFLLVFSIILLLLIAGYALKHKEVRGAFPLFLLMVAAIIWTLGSLFELLSRTFEYMLFWRNIQQIGVFAVPILTVFFAVEYTMQLKLRKPLLFATIIPVVTVLLIFTNEFHGLMRSSFQIEHSKVFGETLVVTLTTLGTILVGYNFVVSLFAIAILFDFRRKVSTEHRRKIALVVLSFLLTFFATWLKEAFLRNAGIHLSISTLYSPSALILFYVLFKYKIFALSPIARDKVFQVINQGVFVVDKEGIIVDSNYFGERLIENCGIKQGEVFGKKIEVVFSDFPDVLKMFTKEWEETHEFLVSLGEKDIYLTFHTYPIYQVETERVGVVLIINDITKQKRHELQLITNATTDSLTQLLNRRSFQKAFEQLQAKCNEIHAFVSLFMIDLDQFKNINDTYGHSGGDFVLQHFSSLLRENLRGKEVIGRLGGEEFAVILPDIDRKIGYQIAERIRKKIEESTVQLPDKRQLKYTVSIGITDNEQNMKDFDEILNEADQALYKAKKNRNRSCVY